MALTNVDLIHDPVSLPRAGRYSDPGDAGDILPIVYGDLTDGAKGIWKAPKIDNAGAGTYCLAGHQVLSVADGNSVSLYDDDGLIPAGEYTFNPNNNFESLGTIATAAFSVAQKGDVKVKMKGENSGATLIENPITQIEDFVTVHGAFAGSIFSKTFLEESRARASSYKGAGVIKEDLSAAEFIQKILGNFLGRFRIGKNRQVELKIELGFGAGNIPEALAGHLPPSRLGGDVRTERRRDEVMNRPAASYRFNYVDSAFTGHDDGTTKRNLLSEALHGVRTPQGGRFEKDWVRDLTTLRAVQDVLVSIFKDGPRVIEYTDSTLRGCLPLELEDFVGFSSDFIKDNKGALLKNQIVKVVGKTVDLQGQRISLRLLDTGAFLTSADKADGSFIANGSRLAGGARDTARYA